MITTLYCQNDSLNQLGDLDLEELSHVYDRLDLEIAKIERDMQQTVETIEAKNFRMARKIQKGNRTVKGNNNLVTQNRKNADSTFPCIVTASGVKSFDGLDVCNTYISSDDDDDLLEDEVESHLDEVKPNFMLAPKGLDPVGSGLYHPRKGRPAYYDMDDEEYDKAYCSDYNHIHETLSEVKSTVTSQLTYNRQMKFAPDEHSGAMVYHRQDSSEKLNSYSSASSAKDVKSKKSNDTNRNIIETRDTSNYIREKRIVSTKVSTRVNESFDSASSLEMSRILIHERGVDSVRSSCSARDPSEESTTPAISNKTRSRMSQSMTCNNNSVESPSTVSSSTTTSKGQWDKSPAEARPYLSEERDRDRSTLSDRLCGDIKLTYRPPYGTLMPMPGPVSYGDSHPMTPSDANKEIIQHIRWKEKWLDERERRFKPVSSYYDRNSPWDSTEYGMRGDEQPRPMMVRKKSHKKKNKMDDVVPFDEID